MASPVGHVVLGLAVARGAGGGVAGEPRETRAGSGPTTRSGPPWLLPALAAFAAVAPDLDFLPGILVGDPNRFHQLQSHSILATVSVGLVSGLALRALRLQSAVRYGLVVGLAYASHLLLDFFTHDLRAPFGIPLWWPFSMEHFTSPWSLFRGILHGVPGQGMGQVLRDIFSLHNAAAVGIELAATVPVLVVVHLLRLSRRTSPGE